MDTFATFLKDVQVGSNISMWTVVGAGVCVYVVCTTLVHRLWWKTGKVVKHKFPNGMQAHMISGDRLTNAVYKELFVDDAYYKHGVRVPSAQNFPTTDGRPPLVLDIGANIGFFAVSYARKVPTYDVISFEPVPLLCECVEKNIQPYHKGVPEQRIRLVKAGLGDSTSRATFEFLPSLSAGTSSSMGEIRKTAMKSGLMTWIAATSHDNVLTHGPTWTNRIAAYLGNHPVLKYPFAPVYIFLMLMVAFNMVLAGNLSVMVNCSILRLTDVLNELEGADSKRRIALMKIDVEGAEMAVLKGIEDSVWARVDQTVIEVHDMDGRLAVIMELLKTKGFNHITKGLEEFEGHRLLQIETIFATKAPMPSS